MNKFPRSNVARLQIMVAVRAWLLASLCISVSVAALRSLRTPDADAEKTAASYTVVSPLIIRRRRNGREPHPRELWVVLANKGYNFTLKLKLNEGLFPPHFTSRHFDSRGIERVKKGHVNCFYHGRVLGHPEWTATMSTCHGLQGSFGDLGNKDHYYHLEPLNRLDTSLDQPHALYLSSQFQHQEGMCGTRHGPLGETIPYGGKLQWTDGDETRHRLRRQTNGFMIVELVIVNDFRQYQRHSSNVTRTVQRALEVTNFMDNLFRVLDIRVVLVESITWSSGDQIMVVSELNPLLDNFRDYHPQIQSVHDTAMLLTGIDLESNYVGIAYVATMCSQLSSVGVAQDGRRRLLSFTSSTAAHELGHILNMRHDNSPRVCTCADPSGRCIMAAVSGYPPSVQWSNCSRSDLQEGMITYNFSRCLTNEPTMTVGDPVCGNGIRERHEVCDCGTPQECCNPCCNASTCTLANGAQCMAHTPCCQPNCRFTPHGTTCREAVGECDLLEYCTGNSSDCPEDVSKQDGTDCNNNQSFCFSGFCRSYDKQCKFYFGNGSGKGDDECFRRHNTRGDMSGNCGYNTTNFTACASEDVFCGQLHCIRGRFQRSLSFAYHVLTTPVVGTSCSSFTSLPRSDFLSPGLVQDGIKCAAGKVCYGQHCIPVLQLPTIHTCRVGSNGLNCSGRGQCNNRGRCSCNVNFGGDACETFVGTDINECSTNNGGCAHNCTNTQGSFTCSCRSGFQLASDGLDCDDINECSTNNGGCAHNCTNTQGSFACSCRNGFQLTSDGRGCDDIIECNNNNGGCAQTCTNSDGSFQCSCRSGFRLDSDGRICNTINQCVEGTHNCAQLCINDRGTFRCSCNAGFRLSGNGANCTDINECVMGNDGCDPRGSCVNTAGSFQCRCDSLTGFQLGSDQRTCVDVNECALGVDNCQHLCSNTVGSFTCGCEIGYKLERDGFRCSRVEVTEAPTVFFTLLPTSPDSNNSINATAVSGLGRGGASLATIVGGAVAGVLVVVLVVITIVVAVIIVRWKSKQYYCSRSSGPTPTVSLMAESDYKIALESKRDFSFTNGGTATVEIIKPATSTEPSTPPQFRPSAKIVGPAPSRPPPILVLPETKCSTAPATHQKSALNEEPQMRLQPKRQAPKPPTQQNLQKNPVCGQDTSELSISPTLTTPSSPSVVEVNPEPMSPKQTSSPPNQPLQSNQKPNFTHTYAPYFR